MGVIQPRIHLGHLQSKHGEEGNGGSGDGEASSSVDSAGGLSSLGAGTSLGTGLRTGARAGTSRARLGGRTSGAGLGAGARARRTGARRARLRGVTRAGARARGRLGSRARAGSSRVLVVIAGAGAGSRGGSGDESTGGVRLAGRLGSGGGGLGLGLGGAGGLLIVNLVAREVEERGGGQVLGNGELHLVVGVGVTEVVPEGGDLVEEALAADLLPVLLGVLDAGLGLIPVGTLVRPASLGDPDGLTTSSSDGGIESLVEELSSVVDAVTLAVLVVGVLIDTDEVNGVENGLVGGVTPDVPGVDVTERNLGDGGVLEGLAEVVNEVDEGVRLNTNTTLVLDTSNGVTVEILATDGDTNDEIGQLRAVLLDGLLEGADLLVDRVGTGGPDTEEDLGLGVDGSLESLNGVILGVSLDVGVESDSVEVAWGGLEALGSLELGLEVGLELGLTVGEGGTGVETKVVLGLSTHGEGTNSDGSG
jgi:hypothetical protein